MRKKIVAANWKMNKTLQEGKALVNSIISGNSNADVTKIIFPPSLFVTEFSSLLKENAGFFVGAQNCYHTESGAFTGEISASAIVSCGATHVIIGHSERRQYFHETAEQLKQKVNLALKHKLIAVYCVGEKLNERQTNHYFTAVKNQLQEVIFHLSETEIKNIVIAYEPVWAIGTGLTASPEQAQEMHAFIRLAVAEKYGTSIANQISILYGGSCNAKNAKELFACADVDGGLIGGASLVAEEFLQITNSF
ncbi:MAG TPA: triose-phosphate isomerase [Bacteroidia bacterium]|nr:triose-phosphate isomerase [Bacteroidia bacterium]